MEEKIWDYELMEKLYKKAEDKDFFRLQIKFQEKIIEDISMPAIDKINKYLKINQDSELIENLSQMIYGVVSINIILNNPYFDKESFLKSLNNSIKQNENIYSQREHK